MLMQQRLPLPESKLDFVSKAMLLNISLDAYLVLLKVTASDVYVQELIDTIRDSDFSGNLFFFQISSILQYHDIASYIGGSKC